MWTEVPELARLIREGQTKWEDLNLDDVDIRMKWAGLFHRGKRTPKKFMMRLKVRRRQTAVEVARPPSPSRQCIATWRAPAFTPIKRLPPTTALHTALTSCQLP